MTFQCPREREVGSAIHTGQWPLACEPELRLHVDQCDHCTRVVLIIEALRRDRAEAIQAARLAPPGLLWWRAQRFRRQRAIQEMAKPISFVGWLTLSVASTLAITVIAGQGSPIANGLSLFTDTLSTDRFWQVAWTSLAGGLPAVLLMLSAGTIGLLGCFALYLAIRRE